MRANSNIVASVHTPKEKFYVRIIADRYIVCRGNRTTSDETDLTAAIGKMLRMAYFETKQTEIPFE